jgi:Arc/MetJ-type ribon-helix-helix transcriptional regulator
VEHGFYANRSEFIRVAIHDQLARHAEAIRDATVRQSAVVGAMTYSRRVLERALGANEKLALRVVGFLYIANDVTPELARATIESVKVNGIFKASDAVKEALADRTS